MTLWNKFKFLWRRNRLERTMAEEMKAHLDGLTERNVAAGMSPDEARHAALRQFGNVANIQERAREQRGWVWLEQILLDFRYAVRRIAKSPAFSLAVIVSLALGIGSAAAIFRVTEHIFFQSTELPQGVYFIGGIRGDGHFTPARFDLMTRAYERTTAMSEYAKAAVFTGNVVVEKRPVATTWMGVTPNLFRMLGLAPALGREFLPEEAKERSDDVVILSNRFWHNYFNSSPTVLGQKVTVGDVICTIVGVLGDDRKLPPFLDADIYRPLVYHVHPYQPWNPALFILGRLSARNTREQAREVLQAAHVEFPIELQGFQTERITLYNLAEAYGRLAHWAVYWVLMAAVGFLYAISCLNASNLALARMLGQRRELSIRMAMGSGRWRLIRLLALESLTLAVLGSLGGILVAHWVFPLLVRFAGAGDLGNADLGWHVLTMLGILTIFTSLCIVIVPAYRIFRADIHSGLKENSAALSESRPLRRLRSSLVVLQAAFAVVLLVGAGLMVRTVQNLQRVDLGFDPVNRVKVILGFPLDYPSDSEVRLLRLHEIQERLQRLPGVLAVEFGGDPLLSGNFQDTHTLESSDGKRVHGGLGCFSKDYLKEAGVKLRRGRWLAESQGNEVLVNESLARALWPGKDPIGQILRETPGLGDGAAKWVGHPVVGVVGDVRSNLREGEHYVFYGEETWMPWNYNTFVLRLRTSANQTALSAIQKELYTFDPRIVVNRIVPMEELRDRQLGAERVMNSVLKVLAGIAAVLTVVGLFSILAYAVDRRMNEFGVRMALGATRTNVMRLVVRDGLVLAGVGLTIGIGVTVGLSRGLAALLYGTSALDPLVLIGVSGILLVASVVACALPSYRASRVDVSRLLRSE
jgi:putative ABC transport system permease protein